MAPATVAAIREKILDGEPIVVTAGESAWVALIGLRDTVMVREKTAADLFRLLTRLMEHRP